MDATTKKIRGFKYWVQFPVGAKEMIDFFSLAAEYCSPWSALQQHSLCFSCKIGAINPLFTGWFIFMVYKKTQASWDQVH
jgi:hypothetical protein